MSVQLGTRRRQVEPAAFSDASDIGHRAPMNGNVGATCRPPAASCTSRIFRCIGYWLSGTDEWKCRCNLPPAGGKLHLPHFPMHRVSAIGPRSGSWLNLLKKVRLHWAELEPNLNLLQKVRTFVRYGWGGTRLPRPLLFLSALGPPLTNIYW